MDSSSLLSDEQIEHFKTHGYLVLKNLFERHPSIIGESKYGVNWDQTLRHLRPGPKTTAVFIVMSTTPPNRHFGDIPPFAPSWNN